MDVEYERISRKQSAVARQRAKSILDGIRNEINENYKYNFRLVGSGAWGTMLKDKDGFDLDYDIILTKGSKILIDGRKLENPTVIRSRFYGAIDKLRLENETL